MARIKSGDIAARLPLRDIEPNFRRAELRFEGIKPPVATFSVRVLADEHCLGTQYLYGLGVADEASDAERTEIRLNITEGLRAYLAQAAPPETAIRLVALDRHGREIPEPELDLEGVSVVTT